MFCPTCQVVLRSATGPCPTCGTAMRTVSTRDAIEVVDASEPITSSAPRIPSAPQHEAYDVALTAGAAPSTVVQRSDRPAQAVTLLSRLPALSLQAWQQPVVRTAVRTGLGAVALSLAARGAQRMLLGQAARRGVAASINPSLAHVDALLRAVEQPARRSARGRRGVEVSETIVIIRRTARR